MTFYSNLLNRKWPLGAITGVPPHSYFQGWLIPLSLLVLDLGPSTLIYRIVY